MSTLSPSAQNIEYWRDHRNYEKARADRHYQTICRVAMLVGQFRSWADEHDDGDVLAMCDELSDALDANRDPGGEQR